MGVLTLTTVFSSLGTTVVYAGDGDVPAVVYDDEYTPSEDSIFEIVEDESDEHSEGATDTSEGATDGSDGSEDESISEESDDNAGNDEAATELSSLDEASSEADSASDDITDEADEAATMLEPVDEELVFQATALSTDSVVTADLSNPEFGEITDVKAGKSELSSTDEEFEIGFSFWIRDAQGIPDGKFTYTLPDSLDFSKAKGNTISVTEGGVEIGTAIVDDNNVMTFNIRTDVLEKKPNGLNGSVSLLCKVKPESVNGDGTVDISFSDTKNIQIVIKKTVPVITGEKGNISVVNGTAKWSVAFDVSADADNFVITDVLGDNLILNGGYKLSGAKGVSFDKLDDHTLKVTVAHIEAGKYTLTYNVKAVKNISTEGMSEEEIFAAGNGNTVTWNWDGALAPAEDTGYATMTSGKLIEKNCKKVSADGAANWEVLINNGSFANDVSGYTFVDVLDSRLEYDESSVQIMYSDNKSTWKPYSGFAPYFVQENGQWKLKIDFPENTPVHYYKLTYSSKIVGDLPRVQTEYTNEAYMYRNSSCLEEDILDRASGVATYSGYYGVSISKEITEERNASGLVSWKAEFTVSGDNGSYWVIIQDTIAPDASHKTINGKEVVAGIVENSAVLNKVQDDGTYKIIKAGSHTKVSYAGGKLKIEAKMLEPGDYVLTYQTQDYYGSEDIHNYPQGSRISFNNNIQIKIYKTDIVNSDDKSYEVTSEGLPMMKKASKGYYDHTSGEYVIPWTVTVNKNDVGQINKSIAAGTMTEVTDVLPENLSYRSGSTKISSLGGETIATTEPQIAAGDNGSKELKWTFEWPEGMADTENACEISFETKVDNEFLAAFVDNSGSEATLSFDNVVNGNAGGMTGAANASSSDAFTFLDKNAAMNEKDQAVDYSILVNDKELDLVDGNTIILSDSIQNGVYVTGSLHVYDYAGGVKGSEISIAAPNVTDQGTHVEIAVPDSRALMVEYQVKPEASKCEEIGNGKVKVTISNTATLRGKAGLADTEEGEFVFDKLSANISSTKGAIRITKVDADNTANGLAGAKFGLYRVNLADNSVSEIAVKETTDPYFSITFSEDGKYDSLIFDTLYYYEELEAPKDYIRDPYRHFVIFKSKKYDSVIADVEKYINDYAKSEGLDKADLEVVDVTNSSKTAEFIAKNSKKTDEEIIDPPADPDPKDDDPKTPEKPGKPGSSDTPSVPGTFENPVSTENSSQENTSVSNLDSLLVTNGNANVSPLDLPEVLGVSINPDDLPEVLGVARESDTGDSDMTGAVSAMIMAFMVLAFIGIRKNKETTGSEKM